MDELQRRPYNARILVVEDEHFMRDLVIQALNSVGFSEILEAENGRNALALLEKEEVDILMTDIEMKQVNGFDLVRAVRMGRTHLPRETPAIFLTGLSDISTVSSASQLGVQGFLVKPVSASQLHDKIREVLDAEVEVSSVEAYREMRLSSTIAGKPAVSTPQPPGREPSYPDCDHARGRIDCLDVLRLTEGMTVRHNVYARGSLLLEAGTTLLAIHILALKDMRGLLDTRLIEVELPNGGDSAWEPGR